MQRTRESELHPAAEAVETGLGADADAVDGHSTVEQPCPEVR